MDYIEKLEVEQEAPGLPVIPESVQGELDKAFDNIEKLKEGIPIEEEPLPDNELSVDTPEDAPEPEEQEEEEFIQSVNQKEKIPKSTWKSKKFGFFMYNENKKLTNENAALRQKLEESINSGTYHYGQNALRDLERAKAKVKQSFENSDVDDYTEAIIELTKATSKIEELEKWKYEQDQINRQPQYIPAPEYNAAPEVYAKEMVGEWLEDHPYLKSNSKSFEPKTYQEVSDYASNLDYQLQQSGRTDLIYSPEYFDYLNNYIETIRKTPKTKIASHPVVGAVRNSYTQSATSSKNISGTLKLNEFEKDLAHQIGLTDKQFLREKYKIQGKTL